MAETLGMLCDKLTIVKLKEYHTEDRERLKVLSSQSNQLIEEIDEFVQKALNKEIPIDKITFSSNKVFKKEGNETSEIFGNIGDLFYNLADVNCKLWHEVEKGYDVKNIPVEQKDMLINNLAVMNLQRNKLIDEIDLKFLNFLKNSNDAS